MSERIPFSTIESVPCPQCKVAANSKCRIMAGRGVTSKSAVAPHVSRVHKFLAEREAFKKES